jgi:hypothetical protein
MQADFGGYKSRLTVAERDRRRHLLLIALTILLLVIAQEFLTQWIDQLTVDAGPPVHETAILISVPAGK